jgi:DNA-binding transcriptional LysR family regulator
MPIPDASTDPAIPSFSMNDALLFVSTVAQGSFTAAAERHGVTASGVSRAITRLERAVGVRLLVRTTRRLRLTEEGELFFEHCRDGIGLMAEGGELAGETSASLRGQLSIGLISVLGTHLVVPLLPNLLAQHPQLTIQLVRMASVAEFYERRVDCALLPGNQMDASLAGRELRPGRMVVVATPEYVRRHGRPQAPEDVHQHRCITLVQADGQDLAWQFGATAGDPAPVGAIRVRASIRTDDLEQVMAAAIAGLGIAQVPHLPLQRPIDARALVVLLEEYEPPGIPLWIVYPARRTVPRRVRAFVDFMLAPPSRTVDFPGALPAAASARRR